ncbi:hypothetical protein L1987_66540 [Smallanthus sonchifolius]|uniref:Uncharacterized protein n=1 Tax=Smallanthus sonchifolius TaxID=185202 RepID=A0ACB9BXF1_9ASTR|nr:hypothetical protein L1987_66540 [Smallanthus sonchifolius]
MVNHRLFLTILFSSSFFSPIISPLKNNGRHIRPSPWCSCRNYFFEYFGNLQGDVISCRGMLPTLAYSKKTLHSKRCRNDRRY